MESCFAWPGELVANRDSKNSRGVMYNPSHYHCQVTWMYLDFYSSVSCIIFLFPLINSLVMKVCMRTNILFWQLPLLHCTKSGWFIHQITLLQTRMQWRPHQFGSSLYFSFQKLCPHTVASNTSLPRDAPKYKKGKMCFNTV